MKHLDQNDRDESLHCEAVELAEYEQGIPKAIRQELFSCACQNGRISYEYLCRLYVRGVMRAVELERQPVGGSDRSLHELIEKWRKRTADYGFYGQPFHPRADAFKVCAGELEAALASHGANQV